MGAVGRPFGVGQAAARQRSASRPHLSRHLVSRAPGRAGLRHPRRHLARLAGRRARPQRHDRLGLHHHQSRQPGPVHRAGRSDRSQPLHHARRRAPVRRARRDDQRPVGRAGAPARARDAARPGDRRFHPRRPTISRRRATCWPCRPRRSTAATPRPKASAASALAQNWDDFLGAARKIVSPMQNIVYADTAGNIGLVSPARVPIRRKGDGSMPVPGWTSENTTGRASCRSTSCRASTIRRAASSSTPTPAWCPTTIATSSAATGPSPTASAAPTSCCARSSAIRSTA